MGHRTYVSKKILRPLCGLTVHNDQREVCSPNSDAKDSYYEGFIQSLKDTWWMCSIQLYKDRIPQQEDITSVRYFVPMF